MELIIIVIIGLGLQMSLGLQKGAWKSKLGLGLEVASMESMRPSINMLGLGCLSSPISIMGKPKKNSISAHFLITSGLSLTTNGAPLMHEKQQEHHQPARFLPK